MRVRVIAQDGIKFTEEVEYVVVANNDGQMAILSNHIPMITTVDSNGYFKLVMGDLELFIVVDRASVVFKDNCVDIFGLNTAIGNSLAAAREAFLRVIQTNTDLSKKENIDFSKQERELRENIMKAGAGNL